MSDAVFEETLDNFCMMCYNTVNSMREVRG